MRPSAHHQQRDDQPRTHWRWAHQPLHRDPHPHQSEHAMTDVTLTRPGANLDRAADPKLTSPAPRRLRKMASPRTFGGVYLWALLILIFGIWVPHTFLTITTVKGVAGQQAITALVCIGLLVPLAAGEFDLSVGVTLGFASVMSSWLMVDQGWSWPPAALATIAVGAM